MPPKKKCRCGRPIKNEEYETCGLHDPTGYHMRVKNRAKLRATGVVAFYPQNVSRRKRRRTKKAILRAAIKKAERLAKKALVVAVQKKRKAKKGKRLKIPAGKTVKIRFFGKPAKGRSHWVPKFSSEMGDAFRIICMRCVDRKKEAAKLHARVDTLLDMGTDVEVLLGDAAVAGQNEIVPKVEQMIQANWAQLKTIRLEKGLAYAEEGDPYSNYRMAGGEEYIIRRMIEKCARALRRCATGKPVDMETWGDLTNMAMILGIYSKVYEK